MKFSFIIVSYNTCELTIRCVQSIKKYTKEEFEIIVVDNDSKDNTIQELKKLDYVKVIDSKSNLGFSKANNIGYNNSSGEIIIFINPDTELISDIGESFSEEFRRFGKRKVILAPLLLNADRTKQVSLSNFPFITLSFFFKTIFTKIKHKLPLKKVSSDWIFGACIVIKREHIEEIGGWNEAFFLYGEDLEICYRYRLHGVKSYRINTIQIVHYGNQSGAKVYTPWTSYKTRMDSQKIFFEKYSSEKEFIKHLKFVSKFSHDKNTRDNTKKYFEEYYK